MPDHVPSVKGILNDPNHPHLSEKEKSGNDLHGITIQKTFQIIKQFSNKPSPKAILFYKTEKITLKMQIRKLRKKTKI